MVSVEIDTCMRKELARWIVTDCVMIAKLNGASMI